MRSSREHGSGLRAGIPQRRRRARMDAGKRACHARNRCWRTAQSRCEASGGGGSAETGGHGLRPRALARSSCSPGGDEGGRGEAVGRQCSTGSGGETGGNGRRPLALVRSSCSPGGDEGGRREAAGRQRSTGSGEAEGVTAGTGARGEKKRRVSSERGSREVRLESEISRAERP